MIAVHPIDQCLRNALAPFDPRLAIVFGSVAKGNATPSSDLDIAILARQPLSTKKKIEIIDTLSLASGRPVDLIDLQTVGEPLLGQILAEGRRIMGPTSEWGRLTSRHLIDQADFGPLQNHILRTRRDAWIKH